MLSSLAALLSLGLCLSQRTSTTKQTLSKPIIWASPSIMVTKGKPVSIWCQGDQEAAEYQLYFHGGLSALERPKAPGSINKVKFLIPAMTSRTAGRYTCLYRSRETWSEPSNPLELVVTGMYDTPNLWVRPGTAVTVGENVTFYCHLNTSTSKFFLLKEGRSSHPQDRHGNTQAEFPIGPVTRAHRGTYRCFGSYNNYVWSFPSEPVTLLVTGCVGNSSPEPPDPTSSFDYWEPYLSTTASGSPKDSAFWDHTTQNLIRIGLAFIVLVAVVWLLAEEWLRRKRDQEGVYRGASWEGRRRWRRQRSLEEQPKGRMPMRVLEEASGPGEM